MKKILTLNKLIGAYNIINDAPLFNVGNKLSVLKVLRVMKPYVTTFNDMKEDTEIKLRPENWEELVSQYHNGNKSVLNDYFNDVSKCTHDELNKEVEIEFVPLTEETICELCTKDIKAGILVELIEIFC